ncbi:hypothetical protein ARALYDRAFT_314121 [Arabidopsis lyrata subsp. lyrata]|uniref:Peptidase A1 domain-containing protein n=1 Tax=Arabidopsis lyrata subsp. lyrata TaxID=81972 RepID=D7KNR6_ARALL|nr:aspartyl protease APCB1 [Arabidopsis lyrata subsp. lyrata]EFH70240.1 hypothetical protein ARALYDRAFT_314121 [Arabidopsis lyrata subsp. lyrata]|eukprot:XP_002893981.1 aspartyl protease APCB1 [Arabidopsis lyrata subsp. lyrata]
MNSRFSLLLFLFLVIVSQSKSSVFKTFPSNLSPKSPLSSVVLPLSGNVFPLGYYSVLLQIGTPPKAFEFDIDTGSDLTWVQCDAPCTGCTLPPIRQYKPKGNTVPCLDPICLALHFPNKPQCPNPKEQCDYEVNYADQGSSMGALVIDQFPLKLLNGSAMQPRLAFGCGYDQILPKAHPPPATAGVLGLGRGKIGVLPQLVAAGLTRNVVGHCLSSKGGGYLFFGDTLIPTLGVAWTPLLSPEYTFFFHICRDRLQRDYTFFKSVLEFKNFFKTITINFTNARRITQLQIPPESYLIISKTGNACLGLLNGSEVGLQNSNVIGDISMQGLMVIYDNEKQQLGWVSSNCNKLPKT